MILFLVAMHLAEKNYKWHVNASLHCIAYLPQIQYGSSEGKALHSYSCSNLEAMSTDASKFLPVKIPSTELNISDILVEDIGKLTTS